LAYYFRKGEREMKAGAANIPKLVGYNCFACGTENPIGLNLHFRKDREYVCADITLGKNYEGWENMAHGGIVSTLLDEIMSWTVIYFKKVFFVTRNMEVKFRRPVPVNQVITVKGKIAKCDSNRMISAESIIQDKDENILARGRATFAILHDKDLHLVSNKLKQDMKMLFDSF
jgi:acyl-coenzyme A thioesterase PaaI-like protein